jgi:hypothetical protein
MLPLPRVDIDRDLPKQSNTYSDISPATLWLSGNWHAITLDGSPDGRSSSKSSNTWPSNLGLIETFERKSRESAQELRGVLDKLKDH